MTAMEYATPGERSTARRIVDFALGKGWTVSVNDGEAWTVKLSSDRAAILAALCTTGSDRLRFREGDAVVGMALLVWGNAADGSELLADHSDNAAMGELARQTEKAGA